MRIYGLRSCDSTRAAMKALTEAGLAPELVDIRATPLDVAEIERFLAALGPALVNRRSTSWRRLSDADRAQSPVWQISAHPALMKRPVIEEGARLSLGWSDEVRALWSGEGAAGDQPVER